ncbi:MAG: sigma-70 family RNA polymerase sigma factor [Bacteroidales bacterium]|nr:sigma-70 family RNA polymerase sigma factor [Bacteroidales bacterium]
MTKLFPDHDDRLLVDAVKSGNKDSFALLVAKYRESVIRICRGYVGSYEDAEDLAQEVFVELFRSISKFRGDSRFSTWLYRLAVNKSLNYLRYHKKRFRVYRSSESAGEESLINSPGEAESDAPVVESDHRRALREALDKLPENQRTAFILNKYEELPYNDVAAVMATTLSTVESLIFRARQNLQKYLSDYYEKNIRG